MRDREVPVVFEPLGNKVYVLPGTRLVEAAAVAGVALDFPCGGQGVCGKCRVRVAAGAAPPTVAEQNCFTAAELADGWRLACQSTAIGAARVEIPPQALTGHTHQILAAGQAAAAAALEPAVRKVYVELPPPAREDDAPDLLRLERAIGPFAAELAVTRELPARLRGQDFRGTAVLLDERLIDFQAGDTRGRLFAAAVDVGTTTLVAALVDLTTGTDAAITARLNPQARFGDDVLSRIVHAGQTPAGRHELQTAVCGAVDAMLGELCQTAGAGREEIVEICFSGNTSMQHLLCGLDPQWLGVVPFVPAVGRGLEVPATELGLTIHPRGRAYVMPVIGGFVGGDTVAGIVATGLCDTPGPTLLVDIGTNGEIVLWADGQLTAASTAAGPAFEGARISQGMRGSAGAIEKVIVDGRLRINVIGNVPPIGVCGSGLIDAAAEMLRHGILSPSGRLCTPDQLPADVPDDLRQRITVDGNQLAFTLAAADETGLNRPIVLTQRDIRELQLASGAIRAGIAILLRRMGLEAEQLEAVLVAGGFGNFIRRSNAQRLGLLPHQVERARIRYQGNTSLAGARLVAASVAARRQAETLARQVRHVDLSSDAAFRDAFADAMLFPES